MARVFFAWELGGGIGHLMRMRPLVQHLCSAGHQVTLAARQLSRVGRIYQGLDVTFLQAPAHEGRTSDYIEASTFPHILHNTGFADPTELGALVASWLLQIRSAQPELIVFDHSPTALLASRMLDVRRAIIGTGFSIPDSQGSFPNWRPGGDRGPAELARDEARILDNVNRVLALHRQKPLDALAQLYMADKTLLTEARELDAVQNRTADDYRLDWCPSGGKPPQWPGFPGKRVFMYVKTSRCLQHLFTELVRRRLPTIVYAGGMERRISELFRAPNINFEFEPLDMSSIAQQCDLAILNAGHNSVLQLLLGGVPQLLLPIFLEQYVTAQRGEKLGAVRMGDVNALTGLDKPLDELLHNPLYAKQARDFAARYSAFDPAASLARANSDLRSLLGESDSAA